MVCQDWVKIVMKVCMRGCVWVYYTHTHPLQSIGVGYKVTRGEAWSFEIVWLCDGNE